MAGKYTIKQGDHISGIARQFGFTDYQRIWKDPQNSALAQKRDNPHVLFPGDILYIPDRETKQEPRPTEARHNFVVRRPVIKLRLTLEDLFENPIGNADCDLVIGGAKYKVTTDAQGRIEQPIPPDTQQAMLVIRDPQTPYDGLQIPVKIGHLDPVEEVSGQVARLNNLGYLAGDLSGSDTARFASAVEEFQCDEHLLVDGVCGPATQSRMKQVHGC